MRKQSEKKALAARQGPVMMNSILLIIDTFPAMSIGKICLCKDFFERTG